MNASGTPGPVTSRTWFWSGIALWLAGMITVTIHEGFHAVTGWLLHLQPVQYPLYVDFSPQTDAQAIRTALAGPLLSFVVGGLLYLTYRALARRAGPTRPTGGFWRVFLLWLGLTGLQTGAGYLFISPFSRDGDTGKVLSLLHAPTPVFVLASALGVVGMLWIASLFGREVFRYTDATPAHMRDFALRAWGFGTVLLVATYFPVAVQMPGQTVLTLVGVATCGIFALMFRWVARWSSHPAREELVVQPRSVYLGGGLALVLALVINLVLVHGLHW